ncbi:SMI1/KNR4 family protein [Amycolatopsis japonica]|uniref:SMI1/KNR4 family protein n=1 Tax=Amycolatopsis japonica TaxID=208439 RepID=UPI0037AD4E3A
MEFDEFDALVLRVREGLPVQDYPEGFFPFDSWRSSKEEIERVERELDVRLPVQYKEFMVRHGGGAFLFVDLLPVVARVSWADDLVSVNQGSMRESGFIAVAPVGTGDWWGFTLAGKDCGEPVDFRFHEDGRSERQAPCFLDFLARLGLRERP